MLGHFSQFPQGGMNHSYIYCVGEYIAEGLECNLLAATKKISANVVKHQKNTKITIFSIFLTSKATTSNKHIAT